jgi:hypothetical protein
VAYFRSDPKLTCIAILTLSMGSTAYAAGTDKADELKSIAATSAPLVTIVAADNRATNLSKSAISLIVLGGESEKGPGKQR